MAIIRIKIVSTSSYTSVFEIVGINVTGTKTIQNCGQKWLAHNTVIITSPKLHALLTAKSIKSAKREDRLLRNLKFCQLHGITLTTLTPTPFSIPGLN